jgi:hypothetical protein
MEGRRGKMPVERGNRKLKELRAAEGEENLNTDKESGNRRDSPTSRVIGKARTKANAYH